MYLQLSDAFRGVTVLKIVSMSIAITHAIFTIHVRKVPFCIKSQLS